LRGPSPIFSRRLPRHTNVSCPYSVRQIGIDLVLGMRLAGVALRPDRAQSQFAHQPSDTAPTDRNPLAQQRHLQPPAAIHRMRGENPIEPIEKIDLLRRYRPALRVEAATRDPEQRALPVTDSPAFGAIIARLSADG